MSTTYESGFKTTLAVEMIPTDDTMTVATAPTITKGRVFLDNGAQQEWISFTGVSSTTLTGLTRGLSKTADPATAGTGLDWMAGTVVKIVAMHDQLADKGQDETISGTWTHTKPLIVSGSTSYIQIPTLTQTERLALTPANGMIVYDSTNGDLYKYTAGSRRAI